MGFMVEDLLRTEECREMKLICGEQGLKNEIKGVTIIEAPDIVKFINGGELLLTGLYAFKSCRDRKSTRLNSSHVRTSRMPSSA